jgi:hypothetical protein
MIYTHKDSAGGVLHIAPETGGTGAAALTVEAPNPGQPAFIPREDIPEVTAEIHQAAGLAAPIFVGDPHDAADLAEGLTVFDGLVGLAYEGSELIPVTVRSGGGQYLARPAELRRAAASLAAFAALVDAEPDAAEVEKIARALFQGDIAADLIDAREDGPLPDMYLTRARHLLHRYDIRERGHG